jgi:hypothetical protein
MRINILILLCKTNYSLFLYIKFIIIKIKFCYSVYFINKNYSWIENHYSIYMMYRYKIKNILQNWSKQRNKGFCETYDYVLLFATWLTQDETAWVLLSQSTLTHSTYVITPFTKKCLKAMKTSSNNFTDRLQVLQKLDQFKKVPSGVIFKHLLVCYVYYKYMRTKIKST